MTHNANDPSDQTPHTEETEDEWDEQDEFDGAGIPLEPSASLPLKKKAAVSASVDSLPGNVSEVSDKRVLASEDDSDEPGVNEVTTSQVGEESVRGNNRSGENPEEKPLAGRKRVASSFSVTEIGGGGHTFEPSKKPIVVSSKPMEPIVSEGEPERTRRRRDRDDGERKEWGEVVQGGSGKWMLIAGVVVFLTIMTAVVISHLSDSKGNSRPSVFAQIELEEVEPLIQEDRLAESLETAKELYGEMVQASEPAHLSEIVYAPETIVPAIDGDRFFGRVAPEGWLPKDDAQWKISSVETDQGAIRFAYLIGLDWEYSPFEVIYRYEDDRLSIDWKATVGYGTASFEEMRMGEGNGDEIRTTVSQTSFYTFALPEDKYQAFRLLSPNEESNIWGYVEKDSEVMKDFEQLFERAAITADGAQDAEVVVRIEPGPKDSLANQWVIKELLATNWLTNKSE